MIRSERTSTNSYSVGHKSGITHTARAEFTSACIFEATVQSTGLKGGDAGHGGVTSLQIRDLGSTSLGGYIQAGDGSGHGLPADSGGNTVSIVVAGDAEALLLAEALEWAAVELRRMLDESR